MEELLDYISNLPKPTTSIEKRAFIQEKKAFVVSDNNLEDECYNCHTKVPSRFIDIYIPEEKGIAHVKYFHTDSKQPFKKCKETFKNKINDEDYSITDILYKPIDLFSNETPYNRLKIMAKAHKDYLKHIKGVKKINKLSQELLNEYKGPNDNNRFCNYSKKKDESSKGGFFF